MQGEVAHPEGRIGVRSRIPVGRLMVINRRNPEWQAERPPVPVRIFTRVTNENREN